jgi:predicted AlkP superfamily pyrophosphatase or phosphodiesterase
MLRAIQTTRFLLPLLIVCVIVAALFSFSAHSRQQQTSAKKSKPIPPKLSSHVILISISGLRSDYLSDQHKNELALPTLRALRGKGAQTQGVESVYPSLSLPAHATMFTGMLPADHGVISDFPFDEKSGESKATRYSLASDIKGETLQQAAQRAGLVSIIVGFPLSSTQPPSVEDQKKTTIAKLTLPDQASATTAVAMIREQQPNLLLVSFVSLDETHRRFGPFSKESAAALAEINGMVKRIVEACDQAGITGKTTFLIAAPYGSAKVESEFRPNVVLAKKKLLTVDGEGRIVSWRAAAQSLGGSAAIFTRDPNDEQIISEVEAAFREVYEKPHSPIWRMIPRRDVSRLGADVHAAFYLDAAPLCVMSDRANGEIKSKTEIRGTNGSLPQRFEMRGALIASGKGIKSGAKVEFARLTDLAPTIARLLGFELKATRGRIISEMLTP